MTKWKKILIIEDNIDIQEIYRINFELAWFDISSSLDGLSWIVKLIEVKPDIIILDLMMPEMDWFEVLKTIKEHSSIDSPVIVCSNLSTTEDEEKAYNLWASLYLRKSDYQWDEIVEKVIEFLKKENY